MPARDLGAAYGQRLDGENQKTYQDAGYKLGSRLDDTRDYVNSTYKDKNGKTPEDHFRELYGSTAQLVGHTYDYAWSWVPFTQKKAQQTKQYAKDRNADGVAQDAQNKGSEYADYAKSKGGEYKDKAQNSDVSEDVQQTLGKLINETRSLVGQILDITAQYIAVAEDKAKNATDAAKQTARDAQKQGGANSGNNRTLVDQARNLTAFVIYRSRDLVTFGIQKADEAKNVAAAKAGEGRNYAGDKYDDARGFGQSLYNNARDTAEQSYADVASSARDKTDEAKQKADEATNN